MAGMMAGLVFSLWGVVVGVVVGWQVSQTMMGVSAHSFFLMFWDMLWLRDVVGLAVKGPVYGLFAAAFACHEGLRGLDRRRVRRGLDRGLSRGLPLGAGDPGDQ